MLRETMREGATGKLLQGINEDAEALLKMGRGQGELRLPLVEMIGRKLLPANEIDRQFDAQYGSAEAQFEFVIFLDGAERERKAVEANVEQFRQSWRRPKWHVLTQKIEK